MQNLFAKTAGVVVALALLVGVAAPTANALTSAELVSLLVGAGVDAETAATLAAVLATDAVGSPASCASYSRDLTIGSTGSDVVSLQTMLEMEGYLTIPTGVSKGYFGSLTQSALGNYQAAHGISPASGYFGPITRSYVNTNCVETPVMDDDDDDDSPSGLRGGEGYFEVDEVLDSDVQIDLGDEEIVMEFDIEAIDSDIQIDRVDFMFSDRPWLYFDEVNLLVDGDEVESLTDSDDFREINSEWRARFTNVDTVIEEDDTVEFALELVVLESLAGSRDTDTITIDLDDESIRGFDADGLQQYGPDGNLISLDVTFDEAFGDGDVDVTLGDDSPDNATIVLDEDSRTDDVTVLEFDVEADDSDIEVQDVTVVFATGTSASSTAPMSAIEDLVNRARLYSGSTLLDTQSVSTTTVVFDDIEYDIDEDDIESFRVELDFNEAEDLVLGEFTVVSVEVDAENGDFVDVSDTLTVNETHTLVVEGLIEEFVSKTSSTSAVGDDTIATFTFDVELTAIENTFYIDENASDFQVLLSTTTGASVISQNIVDADGATLTADDSYRISKGQSETFTVEVKVQADVVGTAVSVRATLVDLGYFTTSDVSGSVDDTVTLGAPEYRSASEVVYDAS